jgi:hypothetical protein
LGFKTRAVWEKKLIQEPGLSENPYWVDPSKADLEAAADGGRYIFPLKTILSVAAVVDFD